MAAARALRQGAPARRRWRRLIQGIYLCLLAVIGAGFVVTYFGTQTYRWQAFDVAIGVAPARRGETRLLFTPLGEVRAATHRTPLAVKMSLQGVSFDQMKRLVAKPPPQEVLEKDFLRAMRRNLSHFSVCQVLLGALGGLLGPLVLRVRRVRIWLFSALGGGGFIALLLLATAYTFDKRAFESPAYTGSLREAPAMFTLARDAFSRARALSDRLRTAAKNLNALYGRISAVPQMPSDEETVRILHVSDIHNNPLAVAFLRDLADKFGVSAVIDTGDLTDYGTPIETQLSAGLARLRVPYVFVAGNHDSEATVRALRANPNTVILDGDAPVTVAGLRIIGSPDPSAARRGLGNVDTPPEALKAAGERLLETARSSAGPAPDIVCVHNPRQAEPLIGQMPLILCGHMHRAYLETRNDTVICNAGTTGGAGVRYLDRTDGVPLSAAVLTFTRSPGAARLVSIDTVILDGSLSQYSISRRTFNAPPPQAAPPQAAPPPPAIPQTVP